jgi:hypothetical protein
MSCRQQPLLQRLTVEEPAALAAPAWQAHLEACPECRAERHALARSLAVFRQFESQPPPSSGPSWEVLSAALERERRQGRVGARLRVPLAAASLLVAVSAGVLLWPVAQEPELPRPAKIVTLLPEQQEQLRTVLHSSLQPPAAVAEPGLTHETPRAAPREPRFVLRGMGPAGMQPRLTLVDETVGPPEPADPAQPGMFRSDEGERAPELLFRSLQQRRAGSLPIQLLPVFAPSHPDPGSILPRALATPRPIR